MTMWFSTFLPFSWGLDFPQECLLHHILEAAGLELGKEMKRTLMAATRRYGSTGAEISLCELF